MLLLEQKDRKFLFDVNVFDAPSKNNVAEDLPPPPPPTFSEDELNAAKDMAFEQGRQQGIREQLESRDQTVTTSLEKIATNFSQLFAAETMREIIFEKEALRLAVATLDLLFPVLEEKLGHEEVQKVIQKTLSAHRKTKEILIYVPTGMKAEIEILINRIRDGEHEDVNWRVSEDTGFTPGSCRLEWSDGGATRDSARAAADIRTQLVALFGDPIAPLNAEAISEMGNSDVELAGNNESGQETAPQGPAPSTPETSHE